MIHDWPILKTKQGREIKKLILAIKSLNEEQFNTLRKNSLPVSMDREHLEKRANFRGLLIFENDTEESLRQRVMMASEWWESGGTIQHMRQVLTLLMKGDQGDTWDYVSGRDTAFRVGFVQIARTQIGDIGSLTFLLKKPSESQYRDVAKYLDWAIAPYLEYKISVVEDL